MARINIDLNKEDFDDLESYLTMLVKESGRIDNSIVSQYPELAATLTEYIHQQIRIRIGGTFGEFMANRTEIDAIPTSNGILFQIYGKKEDEVNDQFSKASSKGKAYNLWAVHEFGKSISASTATQTPKAAGGTQGITRKGRSGFMIEGKKGAIGQIVRQLKPELERRVRDYMRYAATEALNDAARESSKGSQGRVGKQFPAKVNRALKASGLTRGNLKQAGISEVLPFGGTGPTRTLIGRGSKGRFTSLGQQVRIRV